MIMMNLDDVLLVTGSETILNSLKSRNVKILELMTSEKAQYNQTIKLSL